MSPFDRLPETSEILSLESATHVQLSLLFGEWLQVYSRGGPLERDSLDKSIASAVGTLMLRLADMGIGATIEKCRDLPESKAHGDAAILLARTAGYVTSLAPASIRQRLMKHLIQQMAECAGLGDCPAEEARQAVPAPPGLPMTPIRTSACNMTLVADGCYDLPACRTEDGIATYWQPDPESKAGIAAGLPIKLHVAGHSHPPVRLEVDTL